LLSEPFIGSDWSSEAFIQEVLEEAEFSHILEPSQSELDMQMPNHGIEDFQERTLYAFPQATTTNMTQVHATRANTFAASSVATQIGDAQESITGNVFVDPTTLLLYEENSGRGDCFFHALVPGGMSDDTLMYTREMVSSYWMNNLDVAQRLGVTREMVEAMAQRGTWTTDFCEILAVNALGCVGKHCTAWVPANVARNLGLPVPPGSQVVDLYAAWAAAYPALLDLPVAPHLDEEHHVLYVSPNHWVRIVEPWRIPDLISSTTTLSASLSGSSSSLLTMESDMEDVISNETHQYENDHVDCLITHSQWSCLLNCHISLIQDADRRQQDAKRRIRDLERRLSRSQRDHDESKQNLKNCYRRIQDLETEIYHSRQDHGVCKQSLHTCLQRNTQHDVLSTVDSTDTCNAMNSSDDTSVGVIDFSEFLEFFEDFQDSETDELLYTQESPARIQKINTGDVVENHSFDAADVHVANTDDESADDSNEVIVSIGTNVVSASQESQQEDLADFADDPNLSDEIARTTINAISVNAISIQIVIFNFGFNFCWNSLFQFYLRLQRQFFDDVHFENDEAVEDNLEFLDNFDLGIRQVEEVQEIGNLAPESTDDSGCDQSGDSSAPSAAKADETILPEPKPKPYIGYVQYQGAYYKGAIFPTNGGVSNVVIMETEPAELKNLTGRHLMNVPSSRIIKADKSKSERVDPSSWQLFLGRFFGFMSAHNDASTRD